MGLIWKLSHSTYPFGTIKGDGAEYEVLSTESRALNSDEIYQDLAESLELAISKLNQNVNETSRFFLIHWEPLTSTLTLSVTDDQRENDSRVVVRCLFTVLEKQIQESRYESDSKQQTAQVEFSEDLHFWCKEFLSTDQGFSQFSLIALFTDSTRDRAVIL
ncbi:hypothetical protein [Microbulbifer variabilis]|uniref:hypothetical protein n=1 Tax=Microbulbifer variabilis TaxID=266805 RepID=UPI001CFE77AA|nr:hypothetical protein [Microbulbifer variabilis]